MKNLILLIFGFILITNWCDQPLNRVVKTDDGNDRLVSRGVTPPRGGYKRNLKPGKYVVETWNTKQRSVYRFEIIGEHDGIEISTCEDPR